MIADTTGLAPEVTVIVVSYNHAEFVVEALDSIRDQTRPAARVLVIDDASTDDTPAVVRRWIAAHPGIAEFEPRGRNGGLCAALNTGLASVRTPLYTYLSADDRMAPNRLERQVTAWTTDGSRAVAVYSDARRIDRSGRELPPTYRVQHDWPAADQLSGSIHTALLKHCWIPAASVLLDTAAVRAVGGYDERWFFEDYGLWLRLAADGQFLVVDEPLVDFRELSDSLGHRRFVEEDLGFLESRVGIRADHFGVSSEGDAYLRIALPPLAIRLWQRGGDPTLVRKALRKSARGVDLNLRLRSALIALGVSREPAVLTRVSTVAAAFRERRTR